MKNNFLFDFSPIFVFIGGLISDSGNSRKSSSGYSSRSSSGGTKAKASKRSRTNSPLNREEENLSDGASSRIRRKSNPSQVASPAGAGASTSGNGNSGSSESKRRDSIKYGLEELQRALPQFGTPEEEKVCNFKTVFFIFTICM